jgi:carboxymethylenebutenolidase
MGETIKVASRFDGFEVPAYRAPPGNARRGGLIVLQEIFGVNGHIRAVADAYAEEGYEVLAPSMFERRIPGFEGGHDPRGVAKGLAAMQKTPWDQVQGDLQAMIDHLAGPVFVVGYCWGGSAAWLAACRCEGLAAASCYYGRQILALVDETPRCPVILHYGDRDASIPMADVEAVREAHPDIPLHVYPAGHAFNNADRPEHHAPDASHLARLRTLQLFHRASGVRAEA